MAEVEQTRRLIAQAKGKYEGAEEEVALLEEAITITGQRTITGIGGEHLARGVVGKWSTQEVLTTTSR